MITTKPELVYTTYIRTTPEKLWNAITNPNSRANIGAATVNVSDWKPGSKWQHCHVRRETLGFRVVGKVEECVPPKRLVLTWAEPGNEADVSRVTFEIEPVQDAVRLDVIHGEFKPGSDTITVVVRRLAACALQFEIAPRNRQAPRRCELWTKACNKGIRSCSVNFPPKIQPTSKQQTNYSQ